MSIDGKPSEFLFVNRDSSSTSLSRSHHPKEKFDILSHVRRRKQGTRGSGSGTEPWARYSMRISFGDGQSVGESHSGSQGKAPVSLGAASREDLFVSIPRKFPSDNALDPFHCTVAGNDSRLHSLLQFTFSRTANVAFLAEAFAPSAVVESRSWTRHDRMVKARLKQCVGDEMLMYSTLAYSSSLLAWAAGHSKQEKSPDYYLGKALPALRAQVAKLDNPKSPWLLLSMYSLAITELWSSIAEMWIAHPSRSAKSLENQESSRKAARTHLDALLYIIEHIGGFDKVDPYLVESMILADKFLALNSMTLPLIPMSWDPGPLPEIRRKNLSACREQPSVQGQNLLRVPVCNELKHIVRDIVDYVEVAEDVWICPKISLADESWLFLRLQAFSHRLLHLIDLSDLENCIRLTLILFLLNTTQYRGAQISAQILLRRLYSAIAEARRVKVQSGTELLFWCLCTGALTTDSTDVRNKFVEMVAALYHTVDEHTGTNLQERLTSYLFLPERQGKQLLDLVEELSIKRRTESFGDVIGGIVGWKKLYN